MLEIGFEESWLGIFGIRRSKGIFVGNGELHELAWDGRWRGAVVAQREEDRRLQGRVEMRRSVHL